MKSSFPNPWVAMILQQMWTVRQTADVVARSIDPELLLDPQTMTDYLTHPSEKRLNPLEFHGKRRSPTPRPSRSGHTELEGGPQGRRDRRDHPSSR